MMMTKSGVVTGTVVLPDSVRSLPKDSSVTIALQDTSRVDRPAVDITTVTMTVGAWTRKASAATDCIGGGPIRFCLCYHPSMLPNRFEHDWYTLRVKVESADGILLCFNNRIVKALDDDGNPRRNLKIKTIAAQRSMFLAGFQ